jgi:hypothetical protein
MLARSRASAGRYDELRKVRAGSSETHLAPHRIDSGPDSCFSGERSAISALYAARIAAAQLTMPAREIAAAIRTLQDERRAAFRALTIRHQMALAAYARSTVTPTGNGNGRGGGDAASLYLK